MTWRAISARPYTKGYILTELVKKMSYIDALRWLGREYLSADFEVKLVRMGVRPLTAFPSEGFTDSGPTGVLGLGAAGGVATAGGGMHWDAPRTPQRTPQRGRGLSVVRGRRRGSAPEVGRRGRAGSLDAGTHGGGGGGGGASGGAGAVGPSGYCLPSHPTFFEPSFIELNGTL